MLIALNPLACSAIILIAQAYLHSDGTCHSGPGLFTSISNQENAPIDIPIGQSDGNNFSNEIPSSQIDLKFCQIDKN